MERGGEGRGGGLVEQAKIVQVCKDAIKMCARARQSVDSWCLYTLSWCSIIGMHAVLGVDHWHTCLRLLNATYVGACGRLPGSTYVSMGAKNVCVLPNSRKNVCNAMLLHMLTITASHQAVTLGRELHAAQESALCLHRAEVANWGCNPTCRC